MRECGIHVSEELRFYPFRATFDFECYFDNSDLPPNSPKVDWLARHEILSVIICSNVPGFSLPCCFINEGDPNQLVDRFMNYLNKISNAAYKILTKVYEDVFDSLKNVLETATANRSLNEDVICDMINKDNDSDNDNDNDAEDYDGAKISIITPEDIYKLIASLKGFLKELPVIGFNSGRYDLNLIKKYIAPYLLTTDVDDNNDDDDDDDENDKADRDKHVKNDMFVVMRNTNFMCLKTKILKFWDIINYLAPGFSYDKFLKAYGCTLTKGFFPYEWVTSVSKLVCESLPPKEAFFSQRIEKRRYCHRDHDMKTFRDFLIWCNNRDVVPFLEAIEKQFLFYKLRHIDMFKDGISVPGLTMTFLFDTLPRDIYFTLFN